MPKKEEKTTETEAEPLPVLGEGPYAAAVERERAHRDDTLAQERELEESKPKTAKRRIDSKPYTGTDKRWKPDMLRVGVPSNPERQMYGRWKRKAELDRWLDDGWTVAMRKDWGGGCTDERLGDGLGETSAIERNGLIWMEMPAKWAEEGREAQRLRTENQTSAPVDRAENVGLYRRPGHFGAGRWPRGPQLKQRGD
jgi:hypothetical protein